MPLGLARGTSYQSCRFRAPAIFVDPPHEPGDFGFTLGAPFYVAALGAPHAVPDGLPLSLDNLSRDWRRACRSLGLPMVTSMPCGTRTPAR